MYEVEELIYGCGRRKVADVDGGVVRRRLLDNRLVRKRAALEIDGGRGTTSNATSTSAARGGSRSTLGLLVRPVDADVAVDGSDGLLRVGLASEGEEAVAARRAESVPTMDPLGLRMHRCAHADASARADSNFR